MVATLVAVSEVEVAVVVAIVSTTSLVVAVLVNEMIRRISITPFLSTPWTTTLSPTFISEI